MRTETHLSLVECLTLRTPNTGPNGRSQLAYLPDADAVSTPKVSVNDIKVTVRRSIRSYIVVNTLMLTRRSPVSSPPSTIVLRYTAVSTTLALHRTKHVYQDTPFAGSTIDPTAEQSMRTETHLSLVECLTLRTPNTGPNGRSQLAYLPDADAMSTLGLLLFLPLRHTQDTQ